MFETQLKELLNLAAIASTTVASCEEYIRQLQSMKGMIERTGGIGLLRITQVNQIDKLIGKLERRKRTLETEQEFRKRDQVKEEVARKNDRYKVKPLVQEVTARKSYRK
ncbi:hypothetical protein ES702_01989 [subsurface metagenome]